MVPDQKDGTGLGWASLMAMDGTLPAENGSRSTSVPIAYGVGKTVLTVNDGGGLCQSKFETPSIIDASIDSNPCMGALTCAASWDSSW